jgi:hypothetical protein
MERFKPRRYAMCLKLPKIIRDRPRLIDAMIAGSGKIIGVCLRFTKGTKQSGTLKGKSGNPEGIRSYSRWF